MTTRRPDLAACCKAPGAYAYMCAMSCNTTHSPPTKVGSAVDLKASKKKNSDDRATEAARTRWRKMECKGKKRTRDTYSTCADARFSARLIHEPQETWRPRSNHSVGCWCIIIKRTGKTPVVFQVVDQSGPCELAF